MACVIATDPNFIFIHIPSTGGTSLFSRHSAIPSIIEPMCGSFHMMHGHRYLRNFKRRCEFDKYVKFAIVRNPFDRLVSHWYTRKPEMSFYQFVEDIYARQVPWFALKAQSRWISTVPRKCGTTVLADYILRYENYEDEVHEMFSTLGFPKVRIPHLRKTNRKRDYRIYYRSPRTIDIASKLYAEDLENFNYTFEEAM